MSIAFPSSRAPDQDGDVLTSLSRASSRVYSRSGLASARSHNLALVLPIDAIFAPPLQRRPRRSVRDPQIPIGRPLPEPFVPAVSSLGGFRTPAPAPRLHRRKRPASETLV